MKHTCINCARWKQEPGSTFGNYTGVCERAANVEVMFYGDCIRSGQPYELLGSNVWTAERIAKPMVNINAVTTYGHFGCIHWKRKPKGPSRFWAMVKAYREFWSWCACIGWLLGIIAGVQFRPSAITRGDLWMISACTLLLALSVQPAMAAWKKARTTVNGQAPTDRMA